MDNANVGSLRIINYNGIDQPVIVCTMPQNIQNMHVLVYFINPNVNNNQTNDGLLFGSNTAHVNIRNLRHTTEYECAQLTGLTSDQFNRERMHIEHVINAAHLRRAMRNQDDDDIIVIRNEVRPRPGDVLDNAGNIFGHALYRQGENRHEVRREQFIPPTEEQLRQMENSDAQYDGGRHRKKSKNMRLKKKRSKRN